MKFDTFVENLLTEFDVPKPEGPKEFIPTGTIFRHKNEDGKEVFWVVTGKPEKANQWGNASMVFYPLSQIDSETKKPTGRKITEPWETLQGYYNYALKT